MTGFENDKMGGGAVTRQAFLFILCRPTSNILTRWTSCWWGWRGRWASRFILCCFRPNKQHIDALNSLLLGVEREMGLSQADIQARQAVAQEVHALLQPHIPGRNPLPPPLFTSMGWSGFRKIRIILPDPNVFLRIRISMLLYDKTVFSLKGGS